MDGAKQKREGEGWGEREGWGEGEEGNFRLKKQTVCPYLVLLHHHPQDSTRNETNVNQTTIIRSSACSPSQMLVGAVLPMSLQLALHSFDLLEFHVW